MMHNTGMVKDWVCNNAGEKKVSRVMEYVFHKAPKPGLMLDVGANAGFYGLVAARFGHNVVSFDLQPTCLGILRNAAIINGLEDRMWTIPAGVSEDHGNITVPDEGCNGRFPQSKLESKKEIIYHTTTPLHPLTTFISADAEIMLMKVDTEGNEKRVLAGAMDFFKSRKIRNAIVELTPGHGFWERSGITKEEVFDVVRQIIRDHKYVLISLVDWSWYSTDEEVQGFLQKATGQLDIWLTVDPVIMGMTVAKYSANQNRSASLDRTIDPAALSVVLS
jgi:FkbM family methyltransferase